MNTLERERLTGVMGTDSRRIYCAKSRADGAPPDKSAFPRPCNLIRCAVYFDETDVATSVSSTLDIRELNEFWTDAVTAI